MENLPPNDEYRSRQYPIKEHMRFQFFAWKVQKLGFFLIFAFIACACLGLFSQGLLSDASARSESGNLTLEYDRFARNTTETNYVIRTKINKENAINIQLAGNIVNNFDIEYIQPQPQSANIKNDKMTLSYSFAEKEGWYSIYITLKPNKMGYFTNTIALSDREKITVHQLVYP